MSTEIGSSPAARDAPEDDEMRLLAARLADATLQYMRAQGKFNVLQFVTAAEAGMGGTLLLRAASSRAKREVPEAWYTSDGITFTPGLQL